MTPPFADAPAAPARSMFPGVGIWIAAVLVTMPIREIALAQIGAANIRIGDVVLAAAVGAWLLWGVARGRLPFQANGLDLAIFALVGLFAISMTWSIQSEHGWVRVFKLVRNGLLYALIVNYLRHDFTRGYHRIAICLVIGGLMQSLAFLYSIAEYGGLDALRALTEASVLLSSDTRLSVVKTENGAGIMLRGAASWLPLCAFVAIGAAHLMKTHARVWFVRFMAVAMGVLTVLTMSRSAWVGLAVGVTAFVIVDRMRRLWKRVALAGAFALVAIGAGWSAAVLNIIRARIGGVEMLLNDGSITERFEFFQLAVDRFRISPIFGGGVAGIDPGGFITAHNVYLQVLGELGIVGISLFAVVLWLWIRYLWQSWRYAIATHDDHRRIATAAMVGITLFFLTYFLAGHDLENGEPWMVMAMASALHASRRKQIRAAQEERRSLTVPPPAAWSAT